MRSKLVTSAVWGFLFFAVTLCGFGQETRATLGGKVKDSTGAVIRKAVVVVTADETGVALSTQTNESGDWRVQDLVPGNYHFTVSAKGFKTSEHSSIELQISDSKVLDTTLQVGSSTETITVESATPLIDTTSAVSGVVLSTNELEEIPSNSNSPTLMAGLAPGVKIGAVTGGGTAHLWSNASDSAIEVNAAGSGTQAVNYTLNGAADTNNQGQVAFVPPIDTVSEVRVVTNAYDATIGRQSSATISMVSKSGTKGLHGTLFEIDQNNFLNANYVQNKATHTPVPPIHMNEYGGTVGGPVWIPKLYDGRKKKTFFFFTYDGIRNIAPGSTGTMSLPTMLERTGDFSKSFTTQTVSGKLTTFPIQIYDPATINATTFNRTLINGTGTVIPSNRISPIAAAYLSLLPPPDNAGDGSNTDSNNYVKRESQVDKMVTAELRFDQNWNNANRSYVELRRNNWSELSYDPFGPANILNGLLQSRLNLGITIAHTLVISPKFLLDLRYNVTGWQGDSASTSAGVSPTTLGYAATSPYLAMQHLPSIPLVTGIVSGAENGGLGTNQAGSYENDTNQTMVVGMTQTWKNHNFRYGVENLILQQGTGGLGQQGGNFAMSSIWTTQNPNTTACTGCGSALASMLLGLPGSGSIPNNSTAFWSQHYTGLYFQDDWRKTSKLTLNLGLRWDREGSLTERYNRFWSRYAEHQIIQPVTAVAQPAYAALIGSSSTSTGVQLLQQYRPDASTFNVEGGVLYAGVNGTSRYALNPRYKYFQPRLGFAYQIRPHTVIRGGLGRFVQATFSGGSQEGFSSSTPFQATTNNYLTAAATLDNPYPNGPTVLPTGNSLGILTNVGSHTSYTDPNLGRPYVDEASIYIQQQVKNFLFEVGGTLNLTHGLSMGFQHNIPSGAVYNAAMTPTFDSTGRPVDTLAGNVQVTNPFKGAPDITNGVQNNSTISAYTLLRPDDPMTGLLTYTAGKGRTNYYAMNSKVERRFHNGFGLLQSFAWSKRIAENTFLGQQVYGVVIDKTLDTADQRFNYSVAPVYELPLGRGKPFLHNVGKGLNEVVGGWEVTGIYHFLSGTPLSLATNSSFYEGGDPSLGSKKSPHQWFDTSKFEPFPTRSTTVATLATYPAWTKVQAMPGYSWSPTSSSDATKNGVYQDFVTWSTYNQHVFGNIRNPYTTDFTLGVRKSFPITEQMRFQLKIDAFNALNHPRFGNIDTTPGDQYFGWVNGSTTPTQVNSPRAVQLEGKLYF